MNAHKVGISAYLEEKGGKEKTMNNQNTYIEIYRRRRRERATS